jgi:hypothetical protein
MKMASKLTMVLLAGALALPVAGFADEVMVVQQPKTSTRTNSTLDKPADCRDKKAGVSTTAHEKRKKAHSDRQLSGEKITHDTKAAHEHGNRDRD